MNRLLVVTTLVFAIVLAPVFVAAQGTAATVSGKTSAGLAVPNANALNLSGNVTAADLAATDDLTVADDATVTGDLAVGGNTTLTGTAATGALSVTGNVTATGNGAFTGTIGASNYSGTHSGTSSGTNTGDVTLAAAADELLSLSGQVLGFDSQTARTFLAAGASNGVPDFRAIANEDLPGMTEFLANADVIHAAPWGLSGNPGTPTQPVGPTINDAIALINSRPEGGFVLELAPGTYAFPPHATNRFTSTRPVFIEGHGSATIDVSGAYSSPYDEVVKGMRGLTITGVRTFFSSPTGTSFLSTGLSNAAFINIVCDSTAGLTLGDSSAGNVAAWIINDGTGSVAVRGGIISEVHAKDGTVNVTAATSLRGYTSTFPATITAPAVSGIFIDTVSTVAFSISRIENSYVRATGGLGLMQITSAASGADFLVRNVYAEGARPSGRLSMIEVDGAGDATNSLTIADSTLIYTDTWAEAPSGNVALIVYLGSSMPVNIYNVSFGTAENPLPIIAIYHGNWQDANDPGQPTDDRFLSVTNSRFYTTFANTANAPLNTVTPLYLMSRSDSGLPTYHFENNQFFFDGTATQRTNRGMAAIAEIRGAGSGGANGSATTATGNTYARFINNTVYANFPSGTITNGGKGLFIVRDTPIISEQSQFLTPIVEISGLTYSTDGDEDNTIRLTSTAAGNALRIGHATGNQGFDVEQGTPTRWATDTGAIAATGTISATGNISAANFSGSHSGTSSGSNTGDQNLWRTVTGNSGSTTANSTTDTLDLRGGGIASVSISGDTVTITATEVDGSTTNEIQTLSRATDTISLSSGGGSVDISDKIELTDLSATAPITYNNTTGAIGFNTATTALTNYLQLSGGTLTGGLTGTTANFTGNITAGDNAADTLTVNASSTFNGGADFLGQTAFGTNGQPDNVNLSYSSLRFVGFAALANNSTPPSSSVISAGQAAFYLKNGALYVAYNDGGTMKYTTLALDLTLGTTSAP